MEILKNKKILTVTGIIFLLASGIVFIDYLRAGWKLKVTGIQTIPQIEIEGYVKFYLQQNPDNVIAADIEEILKFHPRIEVVHVKTWLKNISIEIVEKKPGFLQQNESSMSELSVNGKVIQEAITQKNHLSEDFPIFYLTAPNQPEIETIRGDIIHLWEKTSIKYGFIWNRISEIELTRNEMNDILINLYHSSYPVKITIYDKMDINSLRKLWAIFYLLDSERQTQRGKDIKYARIYQDHAVLE